MFVFLFARERLSSGDLTSLAVHALDHHHGDIRKRNGPGLASVTAVHLMGPQARFPVHLGRDRAQLNSRLAVPANGTPDRIST